MKSLKLNSFLGRALSFACVLVAIITATGTLAFSRKSAIESQQIESPLKSNGPAAPPSNTMARFINFRHLDGERASGASARSMSGLPGDGSRSVARSAKTPARRASKRSKSRGLASLKRQSRIKATTGSRSLRSKRESDECDCEEEDANDDSGIGNPSCCSTNENAGDSETEEDQLNEDDDDEGVRELVSKIAVRASESSRSAGASDDSSISILEEADKVVGGAVDSGVNTLKEITSGVSNAMGGLAGATRKATGSLRGGATKTSKHLVGRSSKGLTGTTGIAVESVTNGVTNIAGNLIQPVSGAANGLTGAAGDAVGHATNGVTNISGNIIQPLSGAANGITGAAGNAVGHATDSVTNTSGDLIGRVPGAANGILGTAGSVLGSSTDGATSTAGNLIEGASGAANGLTGAAGDAVGHATNGVTNISGNIIQPVSGAANGLTGAAGNAVGHATNSVTNVAGNIIQPVSGAAHGILGTAGSVLGSSTDGATSTAGNLIEGASGTANGLTGAIGQAVGGSSGEVTSTGGDLFGVATAAVKSLTATVGNAVNKVADRTSGAVGDLSGTASNVGSEAGKALGDVTGGSARSKGGLLEGIVKDVVHKLGKPTKKKPKKLHDKLNNAIKSVAPEPEHHTKASEYGQEESGQSVKEKQKELYHSNTVIAPLLDPPQSFGPHIDVDKLATIKNKLSKKKAIVFGGGSGTAFIDPEVGFSNVAPEESSLSDAIYFSPNDHGEGSKARSDLAGDGSFEQLSQAISDAGFKGLDKLVEPLAKGSGKLFDKAIQAVDSATGGEQKSLGRKLDIVEGVLGGFKGNSKEKTAAQPDESKSGIFVTTFAPLLSKPEAKSYPLYQSPALDKLSDKCNAKLNKLKGFIGKTLLLVEKMTQSLFSNKDISYMTSNVISQRLGMLKTLVTEARLAANVGNLETLGASSRKMGLELTRLANNSVCLQLEPNLKQFLKELRSVYIAYREFCY